MKIQSSLTISLTPSYIWQTGDSMTPSIPATPDDNHVAASFRSSVNGSSYAACHVVRQGGTGAKSGTDWNNALPDLPSSLVRGDIYYMARQDNTAGTPSEMLTMVSN